MIVQGMIDLTMVVMVVVVVGAVMEGMVVDLDSRSYAYPLPAFGDGNLKILERQKKKSQTLITCQRKLK